MKQRHITLLLVLIFALTLGLRLFFAFQTPNFTGDKAYFELRQAEHIKETGFPSFDDKLSYGGRLYIFTPLFNYVLALFSLFLPLAFVAKVIPNIFASLLVIVVYLLSEEIVTNYKASLFSAFIAGFIPVFFSSTVNSISPYTLVFPLMFFAIFCFLKINDPNHLYAFLVLVFVLTLTHPSVLLLITGLIIYLILIKLESLKQSRAEIEVIIFSIFLVVWLLFLMFKNALLIHGFPVIWQNIPSEILRNYFNDTHLLKAIYQIGSVPLIYGAYAIFKHIYSEKNRKIYLIISFAISTTLLLWLKLIEPSVGLMCLGIVMAVLFAQFYKLSFSYFRKTRFAKLETLMVLSYLVAFIMTSVIPSFVSASSSVGNSLTDAEFDALTWIKENSDNSSVVFSDIYDGHAVSFIGKRKNVADSNFLFQVDAEQRFRDIEKAYKTMFETEAIRTFNKYGATYVYVSPAAKRDFGIDDLAYVNDEKCFEEVYKSPRREGDIFVYSVKCKME